MEFRDGGNMLYTKLDMEDTKRTSYVREEPCVNAMNLLKGSLHKQGVWMLNGLMSCQSVATCSEQTVMDIV
jgi:hypothetical protein